MRGSRPVLGEAEGEIPSVYLPHVNEGVFQLLKEVTFRRFLTYYNTRKWGNTCFLSEVSSISVVVSSEVSYRIFPLLSCFVVAEYALSHQNTT